MCTDCSFSPVLFRWAVAIQVSTWTIASAPQLVRRFDLVWATTASLRVVGMDFGSPGLSDVTGCRQFDHSKRPAESSGCLCRRRQVERGSLARP